MIYLRLFLVLSLVSCFLSLPPAVQADWPMAGANPQRTSWVSEEVSGNTWSAAWYRIIEPYISTKIQVIAAQNTLFISTAAGLYAFEAQTGIQKWLFPTSMPLGHSPTYDQGVIYVGGLDHRLYALNATTGAKIWDYAATAGFDTNPLVVNNTVYSGNRNGIMYAINSSNGDLIWQYSTDGPIHFSAAYKNNMLYFASDDMHAYALNAQTGSLIWKSSLLPGSGFFSYWPVVFTESGTDYLILGGSNNFRIKTSLDPSIGIPAGGLTTMELYELFPNYASLPAGTPIGSTGTVAGKWANGTRTIDAYTITEYFEAKPWRRTYFVLNAASGQEYTYDSDNDGKVEFAPVLWAGTHSGQRYPAIIGNDGVPYQMNMFYSDPWIAWGDISGWKFGTPYLSVPSSPVSQPLLRAIDQPSAYSAGGRYIYISTLCDAELSYMNLSTPSQGFNYVFNYDLAEKVPGYNTMYTDRCGVYGSKNGHYGQHNTQTPAIPYQQKLYIIKGNALIAFTPTSTTPVKLPNAVKVNPSQNPSYPTTQQLKSKLATEVAKIISAGHLRPGYGLTGLFDTNSVFMGDYLFDYFRYPSETLAILIKALPHLSPEQQVQTRQYIQTEFTTFPPITYAHIGWKNGTKREWGDVPQEISDNMANFNRLTSTNPLGYGQSVWWRYPQPMFYHLWQFAKEFGDATNLYASVKNKIEPPLSDNLLIQFPHIHNGYISGYIGYLNLEKLAGQPETSWVKTELNRLLNLRAANFSKDMYQFVPANNDYYQDLLTSVNFINLTPELAEYLRLNAVEKIVPAINEYTSITPYWFVTRQDTSYMEGIVSPLYDSHALFQAKALILKEPYEELVKYLDVPAFERGDLFYIDNLVAALEASSASEINYDFDSDTDIDWLDFSYVVKFFGNPFTLFNFNSLIRAL